MKVMAFKRINVLQKNGLSDPKSYIAPGDLCQIGEKTVSGLWPVTYPTARGAKTRYLRSLQGFLCNQNDYAAIPYPAKGYEKATVKSGGCGVCASVNAVGALTEKCISVRVMAQLAMDGGARVSGGTDMQRMMALVCQRYKLKCETTNVMGRVESHLQKGGVVIANVAGRGMFSSGGHYITILGKLGGRLCIADSGLYTGKYSTAKRRPHITVSGDLIFAEPGILDADCVGRWPRYYLLSEGG